MQKSLQTVLALALLLCLAPVLPAAVPADFAARIDRMFEGCDYPDMPGAAVGVIRDGTLIFEKGYGMASLESGLPNASTTPFHIYSISKQFTAVAVYLLEQDGKLSLDDDVRKHIPELPDYGRPITLRMLANHTGGVREYLSLVWLAGQRNQNYMNEAAVLPLLARQKELNFPPGERHAYTNSGYLLLSMVVQRVSGQSLRRFTDERIFKPLGMTQTHFHDDWTEVVPGRAWGYFPRNREETVFGLSFESSNLVMGCGGMMSTIRDLYLWDQNAYHPKVGGPEMIAAMETPGKLADGGTCNYGLGVYLGRYNGLRTVGHSGAFGAFRSEMVRFPEHNFSVIVLANHSEIQPGRYVYRIADLFLSDHFTEEATGQLPPDDLVFIELPEEKLREKEGTYRNPATGSTYRFFVRDGGLRLWTRGARFPLAAVSEDVFVGVNTPTERYYRFEFVPQNGGDYHVKALYDGRRNWNLVPYYNESHSPDQLAAFTGAYYNDELETTYTVVLKDEELYFETRNGEIGPLRAVASEKPEPSDTFRAYSTDYAFFRGESGKVEGFRLDAGRVQNLRFVRVGD